MSNETEWVKTWTTAPAEYDGFGTERIKIVGVTKNGGEMWEVRTPEAHVAWQRGRYYSGSYVVILTADDLQDQKDFGLVVVL